MSVRSEVTQGTSGCEKKKRRKNPNMCTRAEVARGLSFTHASRYLGMQKCRRIPALSAQERALESAGDFGVTSIAISTHFSYQYYIRIY